MRILFVLGFPVPFPGAAWSRIGYFAETLLEKGHEVEVLGSVVRGSFTNRSVSDYHQVRIFNLIPAAHLNDPIVFMVDNVLSFATSVLFLLCRRPDITVVSLPPGHSGLGVLIACRMLRIRHVVDYRDEWEGYISLLSKSRLTSAFFAIVSDFAVSIYSGGQLVATTPNHIDSLERRGLHNARLVPNGADISIFRVRRKHDIRRKMGIGDDDFVLVYSGTLERYYRLDDVVRAIAKFKDEFGIAPKLLVVGGGTGLSKLVSTVNRVGLGADVMWMGIKENKEELAQILASADVGLIPYDCNPLWKNTLPAKFFEYCACGLTILATTPQDSLLAAYVTTYEIGAISPPMNQSKLVENMYRIYSSASFRSETGSRARLLAEQRFDRRKIAEEFLSLFERVPHGDSR